MGLFDQFYLTIYSISNFCTMTFALVAGGFLLTLRTMSTRFLAITMLAFVPFFLGYFWTFSWIAEGTAFHRWLTVGFILPTETLLVQYILRFPDNRNAALGNKIFAVQLAIALGFLLFFMWASLRAPSLYSLDAHYFDFFMPTESKVIGTAILLFLLPMIVTVALKWKISAEPERSAYRQFFFSIFPPIIILAGLNYATYLNLMGRDTFAIFMAPTMILTFLAMIIIYLKEKSGFWRFYTSVSHSVRLMQSDGIPDIFFEDQVGRSHEVQCTNMQTQPGNLRLITAPFRVAVNSSAKGLRSTLL